MYGVRAAPAGKGTVARDAVSQTVRPKWPDWKLEILATDVSYKRRGGRVRPSRVLSHRWRPSAAVYRDMMRWMEPRGDEWKNKSIARLEMIDFRVSLPQSPWVISIISQPQCPASLRCRTKAGAILALRQTIVWRESWLLLGAGEPLSALRPCLLRARNIAACMNVRNPFDR